MNRKLVSILLSLSLVLALLSACGDSANTSKTAGSGEEPKQATNEKGEVDYAFGSYEEPVTLHTVRAEYASAQFPNGDNMTNNIWTRAYKERFNIDVVTDWVTDEYDTKLNLAISSKKLPDVFHVNPTQLQQLIKADMIMDLTEVFDKYASDRVKSYMEADRSSYESGMKDGKLYGIPQMHWGIIDQPDYIWIRNDWKEELGLPDPTTTEDIKNIALKFKEAYGGFGIAADQTLDYLNLLAIGWGAHPDMWIPGEDGKLVYGTVQPEMKAALADWAEWYKLGIIDPEFAIKDFSAMNAGVVSGKSGIQPYYQWWGYNPGVDVVTNLGKDAIFYPYNIPTVDGKPATHSIFFANGVYTVVNKNCKNPEAAIKLLNFYASMLDEGSQKEDPETLSAFLDNDIAHVTGAFKIINPETDYTQFEHVSEALKTNDTSKFTTSGMWQKYNNSVEFKKNGTPAATGDFLQQGSPKPAYGLAKSVLDNEQYIKTALWGAPPEVLVKYGSTLDDILTEGFTKIIMGAESIDYFDKVVENWRTAGGNDVTEAVNEMYGQPAN
ncbi:MAG: extracellular solute-binding protein [Paenibacillus sp.]|uniref:extracellular solute-binding protein n=1 Tax=Paenibacillus sp. TaxID=58172 RepID=UPI0029064A09|nr:extracellular solute-binding protein [Paenibacillus sp.]MDU4696496.1 extracellular solute-binding protein [Paenibacillus sp.]